MKSVTNLIGPVLLSLTLVFPLLADDDKDSDELFEKATEYRVKQEWEKATSEFEKFLQRFPNSEYEDDARFWYAYSLENLPGQEEKAFAAFGDFVEEYTISDWQLAAIVHQLKLAEKLVSQGHEDYQSFVNDQLDAKDRGVRERAVIAKGRLGDGRMLPALRQMTDDEDLGHLARQVIAALESDNVLADADTVERISAGSSFSKSKRYAQYQVMLRKDEGWTWPELKRFGLWHIAPEKDFAEYLSFTNEYDCILWYAKFWEGQAAEKKVYPQELRLEFERRVAYARANFSAVSDKDPSKYLSDSYLYEGSFRAPWDARGELYIKYGEPMVRNLIGFRTEHWDYTRDYNIDFQVTQYMTNIRKNAITNGPVYNGIVEYDVWRFENEYSLNCEFRYNLNAPSTAFGTFKAKLEPSPEPERGDVLLNYAIPTGEFTPLPMEKVKQIIMFVSCVVLDTNKQPVLKSEKIRIVDGAGDVSGGTIDLDLEPGDYEVILKVHDMSSEKEGRFEQKFRITG